MAWHDLLIYEEVVTSNGMLWCTLTTKGSAT